MANEGDADLPKHTIDDIVARGRGTQFQPGNQVARGHGKGRPKKKMSKLYDRLSEKGLREMERIAFDRTHPRHDREAGIMLRDLVKYTTPRRKEITGKDGETLKLVDAHELVYGKPRDDDGDDEG